jgi:hypothetical protein
MPAVRQPITGMGSAAPMRGMPPAIAEQRLTECRRQILVSVAPVR